MKNKIMRGKLFTAVMTGATAWSTSLMLLWAFTRWDAFAVAMWSTVCGMFGFMSFMSWCETKEEERKRELRKKRRAHRTDGKLEYENAEFWWESDVNDPEHKETLRVFYH